MPFIETLRHPVESVKEKIRQHAFDRSAEERLQAQRFLSGHITDQDRHAYKIDRVHSLLPIQVIGLSDTNIPISVEVSAEIDRVWSLTPEEVDIEIQNKAHSYLSQFE